MLNLNVLSQNLFSPLLPISLHKQWSDPSSQAPVIYSEAIRMLCPEKDSMSFHPLLSDGPERVLQSQHISGEKWLELSRCPSHDKTTFCVCFSTTEQPLTLEKPIIGHTTPASPAADRLCHNPGGFMFNLSSPTSLHSSLTVSAAVVLTWHNKSPF